jgi:hypothetical protein
LRAWCTMKRRGLIAVFLIAIVAVILSILASSCGWAIDPHSKTPGYRLYTGRTDGFRVSFEYPDVYSRYLGIEKDKTSASINLYYETDHSIIGVVSYVNTANGGHLEDAHAAVEHYMEVVSKDPEFQILSQKDISLGGATGEEVICSSRQDSTHAVPPVSRIAMQRFLAVDYGKRIYEIDIIIDADKYMDIKDGFEHLLATFRFLE